MHRLMAVSSAMRARAAGRRLVSRRHLSAISMSESFLPLDTFVNRHCGSSPDEIQTMLDVVGVNHLEGLSEQCVPKDIYLQRLLKVWPGRFGACPSCTLIVSWVVCRPGAARQRRNRGAGTTASDHVQESGPPEPYRMRILWHRHARYHAWRRLSLP